MIMIGSVVMTMMLMMMMMVVCVMVRIVMDWILERVMMLMQRSVVGVMNMSIVLIIFTWLTTSSKPSTTAK